MESAYYRPSIHKNMRISTKHIVVMINVFDLKAVDVLDADGLLDKGAGEDHDQRMAQWLQQLQANEAPLAPATICA